MHSPLPWTTFLTLIASLLPLLTESEYISITITPASYIINEVCSYKFDLSRSNNPTTNSFNDPIVAVPSTAYIEIKMPTAYTRVSSLASPACFNSQTGVALSCTVNLQTNVITVNGFFATASAQIASLVSVTVNSIKNPGRADSSGNF